MLLHGSTHSVEQDAAVIPKFPLRRKKNCAQKNLEPNSIFGNGFLEIEKLAARFH
jgi:hypothetical protein